MKASRAFCAQQELLGLELKAAREAERLRGQIAEAVQAVDALRRAGGGQDSDPRGTVIGRFTGLRPGDVAYGLELCLAILVEFLAFESATGQSGPALASAVNAGPTIEVVQGHKREVVRRGGGSRPPRRVRLSADGDARAPSVGASDAPRN